MPIFEYRCSDCNQTFEDLVIGQAREAAVCTSCGSSAVKRVHSTFAAQTSSSVSTSAPSDAPMGSCACGAGPAGMCGMN
jgi:putative FmdB family regulatory protein